MSWALLQPRGERRAAAALDRRARRQLAFGSTAHTGYDSDALMYFHFARHTQLCGSNGSEASARSWRRGSAAATVGRQLAV